MTEVIIKKSSNPKKKYDAEYQNEIINNIFNK